MPLQNRVTPTGEIIATPHRGLFMGNRGGQIHDAKRTLSGRRWTSRAWITCVLEWKGRREVIMADRRYTQLFFLDEATALAAGHRPCALCRRADYTRFMAHWAAAHDLARPPLAPAVDHVLHGERLTETGGKRTHRARLTDLPDGCFVVTREGPALKLAGRLLAWTPAGYSGVLGHASATADVLTPPGLVAVLKAGYRPLLHPSSSLS